MSLMDKMNQPRDRPLCHFAELIWCHTIKPLSLCLIDQFQKKSCGQECIAGRRHHIICSGGMRPSKLTGCPRKEKISYRSFYRKKASHLTFDINLTTSTKRTLSSLMVRVITKDCFAQLMVFEAFFY